MKLAVFLGSGISVPSGLPSVDDLMETLLKAPLSSSVIGRFETHRRQRLVGLAPGSDSVHAISVARIRRFLRLLVEVDQADRKRGGVYRRRKGFAASGMIYRRSTTYEDLFALCQAVDVWVSGQSEDSLSSAFIDLLERKAGTQLAGTSRRARAFELGRLAQASGIFIRSVVLNALESPAVRGLDLLVDLARSNTVTQLNIVTLNHDVLVERVFANAGITVVDGFGEPDGDVRWYKDSSYDAHDARVLLFKLHGSIDWYEYLREGKSSLAQVRTGAAQSAVDGSGTPLTQTTRLPSFLTGGHKEAWYQHGHFADVHFRFHEVLRRCDKMIVSGYGWRDQGITNQIDRWLDSDTNRAIALLHQRPEELGENSSILAMGYDSLRQSGQLIPIRKWMCDTTLAELAKPLGLSA